MKAKVARAVFATAAIGAAVASALPLDSAKADPKQYTALTGVGSDTTEQVLNAFTGFAGGQPYPAITSASPSFAQVASWDALGTPCITTKIGGPSFNRPNGSGSGVRALSRSLDATGFGTAACGGVKDVTNQIDFARSSSGPGAAGTALTYVPFARDGVSFAYYRASGGSPVTTLTKAQLNSIFTNGPTTIDNVLIIPCGIQTGSGTYTFWNSAVGVSAATEAAAVTTCGARVQENDAAGLKARGDAVAPGAQVIVGFSAANWVAKSNLVTADPAPPAGTGIGAISDAGGLPVTGTAPSLAPNPAFYESTTSGFGRYVYNVVATARIDAPFGNPEIKGLFSGPTSAVCTADATTVKFGFLPLDAVAHPGLLDCGDRTTKGGFLAGQS